MGGRHIRNSDRVTSPSCNEYVGMIATSDDGLCRIVRTASGASYGYQVRYSTDDRWPSYIKMVPGPFSLAGAVDDYPELYNVIVDLPELGHRLVPGRCFA